MVASRPLSAATSQLLANVARRKIAEQVILFTQRAGAVCLWLMSSAAEPLQTAARGKCCDMRNHRNQVSKLPAAPASSGAWWCTYDCRAIKRARDRSVSNIDVLIFCYLAFLQRSADAQHTGRSIFYRHRPRAVSQGPEELCISLLALCVPAWFSIIATRA